MPATIRVEDECRGGRYAAQREAREVMLAIISTVSIQVFSRRRDVAVVVGAAGEDDGADQGAIDTEERQENRRDRVRNAGRAVAIGFGWPIGMTDMECATGGGVNRSTFVSRRTNPTDSYKSQCRFSRDGLDVRSRVRISRSVANSVIRTSSARVIPFPALPGSW